MISTKSKGIEKTANKLITSFLTKSWKKLSIMGKETPTRKDRRIRDPF
jgi:hypothetical protein